MRSPAIASAKGLVLPLLLLVATTAHATTGSSDEANANAADTDANGSLRGVGATTSDTGTTGETPGNRDLFSINTAYAQDENEEGEDDYIDLDFRFNKFQFMDEDNKEFLPDFMPLKAINYPIRGNIAATLKNQSNAVSVLCDGDPALEPNHRIKIHRYLDAIGGLPTMPRNPNSTNHVDKDDDEFWNEFRQVTQLQVGRRNNMQPGTILRAPDLWLTTRNDIHAVAEAVHLDYPGSLQVELIQWLWSQDLKMDHDIVGFRSNADFVGLQIAMADLNTWAIGAVAPMNFYLKWIAGRPRPEEVAYAITTRQLTYDDGVPPDIVQLVDSMDLKSPEEYTAYPEGAPRHPSWPAMHSAASSASFWLAMILDLTPDQYCEALRVDFAVAFGRTCAGVHYPTDNTAGLNLGQVIISEKLPAHLAAQYGSDPEKVQAKIDRLRFDWTKFDSFGCTGAPNPKLE